MINLRLALRSLLKTPGVTLIAVLSLALGIGANAAIFSIFERLVLRPLPVPQVEELVNLEAPGPKSGSQSTTTPGGIDSIFSYPMFRDLEAAVVESGHGFESLAAHCPLGVNLAYAGDTLSASGMLVSGRYFETLGLQPAAGRLLGPDDDRTPGAHALVVLDHSYWQTRFEGSEAVVGETLVVNGKPMTILGVAPEGFEGTTLGVDPKVYVPLSMRGELMPGWEGFEERRSYWAYVFGRLEDGVALEEARAALDIPYTHQIREVEVPLQNGLSERVLEQFEAKTLVLTPGHQGQSNLRSEVRTPVLLLLGVTGFVLLIACANLVNLLLVRSTRRSSEIAVRMSIGARRWQIVAQLLAESLVLASLGSLLGLGVAQATLKGVVAILPANAGAGFAFQVGPTVWIFLAAMAILTGLVGLVPALHTTRTDVASALKSQGNRAAVSRGSNRFRTALVTCQIALSMTLLASAGLFLKSLNNVTRVDLGLEKDSIATFGISPELNGYTPEASRGLFERLEGEIQALPGVHSATASRVPLISGSNWGSNVSVQGFEADLDTDTHANYSQVGPGFFKTLGIPLLAGREFEDRDVVGSPQVVVVNETFAQKFGLGRDAVGRWMQLGSGGELDIEIVGLVQDAKYSEVKSAVPPLFYLPYRQSERIGAINFYVRAKGDPSSVLPDLRAVVARLDPNLPVEELKTLAVQVDENIVLDRLLSTLSAAFATLATLLAAIGLYGVLAFTVGQRTREIGLRMALGADAGGVRRMVLGQVAWMTLVGGGVGVLAALGLGRMAGSMLFGLEGHDPKVFFVALLVLALVALLSGLLPAQRAASVDPMHALRDE